MKTDLDISLTHDGRRWVARGAGMEVSAPELGQLDARLAGALHNVAGYPVGTEVVVFMGVDRETLPVWLRQYASHYFNRLVHLTV